MLTLTREIIIEWKTAGSPEKPTSQTINLDLEGKKRRPNLFGFDNHSNPTIAVQGDRIFLTQESALTQLPLTETRRIHTPIATELLKKHPKGVEFVHMDVKSVGCMVETRFSISPAVSQLGVLLHDSEKTNPTSDIEMVITRKYR